MSSTRRCCEERYGAAHPALCAARARHLAVACCVAYEIATGVIGNGAIQHEQFAAPVASRACPERIVDITAAAEAPRANTGVRGREAGYETGERVVCYSPITLSSR